MWHVTQGGSWTFSQNFMSLALTVWEWRCLEDIFTKEDQLNSLINQWVMQVFVEQAQLDRVCSSFRFRILCVALNYNHLVTCLCQYIIIMTFWFGHQPVPPRPLCTMEHTCQVCHRVFQAPSKLKIHIRTHSGEKSFSCSVCNKTFSISWNLKSLERTHNGEKLFPCNACVKSFSQSSALKTHKLTHSGKRPFSCSKCEKSFSWSGHLKRHMRTHTGEKPHLCLQCDKTFSLLDELKRHQRSHSGEKPFSCTSCGKSFSQSGSLNNHSRIHTGEKVFSCRQCDKTFYPSRKPAQSCKNSHRRQTIFLLPVWLHLPYVYGVEWRLLVK